MLISFIILYGLAHKSASTQNSVLIADAQLTLINNHAGISSKAGILNFDLILYLLPYFVKASSEDSGKSALLICTYLSEPSLLADAISTQITCTGYI